MPAIRNASFGRHLSAAAAAAPCVAYAVLFATSDSYQASPIGMGMKCEKSAKLTLETLNSNDRSETESGS